MVKLKYQIEDSTIAELLGRNNFTNAESAILELVKNSYDAFAKNVNIYFEENLIKIVDDGTGMCEEDIKSHWMHIGHSSKGYADVKENETRIMSGSKGIGRFALSRLGENVKIESKKSFFPAIKWTSDWIENVLDVSYKETEGTDIFIYNLRDKWSNKNIRKLIDFLRKTYNDDKMQINIYYNQENKQDEMPQKIKNIFNKTKLGINYLASIQLQYDASNMQLSYTVISDEFHKDAVIFCNNHLEKVNKSILDDSGKLNLNFYSRKINIFDELKNSVEMKDLDISENDLPNFLERIGDFDGVFYYGINPNKSDLDKFFYKHDTLDEMKEGVILYRNAFSISSFEGRKDWLEFGKRSRKSPAAATHPTGAWRIRENQISGYLSIDKKRNEELKDLSNRQGLDENEYFELFKRIILCAIKGFEYYRQSIIRIINIKNEEKDINSTKNSDEILKDPQKFFALNKEEQTKVIFEIQEIKKGAENAIKEKKTSEIRYKYDVRILNVLSTLGLRAASISHEMLNDKVYIFKSTNHIIAALKELNLWDTISNEENTKCAFKNIPGMLERNHRINLKLIEFMDTMLYNIEKQQFEVLPLDVSNVLKSVLSKWEKDYSWVRFNLEVKDEIKISSAVDIFEVIFDNLILNSIQQNNSAAELIITIKASLSEDNKLDFSYRDNGRGLPIKYASNPMRILEVHETSRRDGHGLGMWMVNNTLNMTGGRVTEIKNENGFCIDFVLGDDL